MTAFVIASIQDSSSSTTTGGRAEFPFLHHAFQVSIARQPVELDATTLIPKSGAGWILDQVKPRWSRNYCRCSLFLGGRHYGQERHHVRPKIWLGRIEGSREILVLQGSLRGNAFETQSSLSEQRTSRFVPSCFARQQLRKYANAMIATTINERERNRFTRPSWIAGTAEKSIPHASQYGA